MQHKKKGHKNRNKQYTVIVTQNKQSLQMKTQQTSLCSLLCFALDSKCQFKCSSETSWGSRARRETEAKPQIWKTNKKRKEVLLSPASTYFYVAPIAVCSFALQSRGEKPSSVWKISQKRDLSSFDQRTEKWEPGTLSADSG